jgi:hypothetical protein
MNSTSIVAVDNQAQLMALITFVNKTISQSALALIWFFGNIGSAFNCAVFYQPAFRKSPCAMHFIAASVGQLFTFNLAVFIRMLEYGYGVPFNAFVWLCKIRFYIFYVFVANSHYNIIMASMDRYLSSSRDALRRQWSSPKIALRLIIINFLVWCLMYLQVLVFFVVTNGKCGSRLGTCSMVFSIYLSIDSGILPILLMLVFGLLTINNVHQSRRRINEIAVINADGSVHAGRMSRKDTQLHKMLANQIILFIILDIPNPFYFIYRAFTVNTVKSAFRVTAESFANNLTYDFIYLGFALTFPNYALSSEMYRRELQQLIQTKILRRCRRRVTPE